MNLDCGEVRDLLPELALGSLDGATRADVLEHIAHCPGCRAEARALADVVDGLTTLAPEVEPPSGFADGVLDALRAEQQPRRPPATTPRRWRTGHLVAAAVIAAVVGVGATVAVAVTRHEPSTDVALNARTLRVVPMVDDAARTLGDAYVSRGQDPWVLVDVSYLLPADHYRLVGADSSGWLVDIGAMRPLDGRWAWAGRVDRVGALTELRIVDGTGTVVCRATLA
ncbi:MAG TPA: zf-HC2 domain-containing protein [Acidimicrobiales bacterium]|nr:zf-HC2 domain-containing protein [Acidimicrobiales bacterium]